MSFLGFLSVFSRRATDFFYYYYRLVCKKTTETDRHLRFFIENLFGFGFGLLFRFFIENLFGFGFGLLLLCHKTKTNLFMEKPKIDRGYFHFRFTFVSC